MTESQMKTQKLFLKYVGQSVGVKLSGGNSLTVSDMISEDVLAWYGAHAPQEVSASGEPNLVYYTPRQYEELYYGYVVKVHDLLKKSRKHKDEATRLHYQLMLHMLETAMK